MVESDTGEVKKFRNLTKVTCEAYVHTHYFKKNLKSSSTL